MKTTTYNSCAGKATVTFLETDDQIIIASLYVDESCRNKGVASSLLDRVKGYANKKNLPVYLRATPNRGFTLHYLMTFYSKRGFEPANAVFGDGAMVYHPKPKGQLQSIATAENKL